MVLVCISLIANVEQLSMCWPRSFLSEMSVHVFCAFSDWIVWGFLFVCLFFTVEV